MAAVLRHWSLHLTLDGHPIGELQPLDDVDLQVTRTALKTLFGGRLRTRTAETWLRRAELEPGRPLKPPAPARPRLRHTGDNAKKVG